MLDKASDPVFGPVFDAVDIGLVVLDRQNCIVRWNQWIARVSRRQAPDVLGKALFEVFPEVRHTRLPDVINDSFCAGSSSILTHTLNALLPLQGESGEPLLHNIVVRPVSSVHANYCLLQISDVTVAVARERVLRDRQNARYHAIVDSAPDAIITTSLDRTIHWINGAAERVFGSSPDELLGRSIDTLVNEPESFSAGFAGETVEARIAARRKDKETGHFEVSFGRWKADE